MFGSTPAPRLVLRNVAKTFPGQVALAGVDLELQAGKVHGLVGQNGSGKSTLIKILAGFHDPDPGASALLDGCEFSLGSAMAAERAGMWFIHQDLGLVPTLDAVDNLALGHGYASRRWVRLGAEARNARTMLSELGFELDVRRPIATLDPGQRSGVAITRALRPGEGGHALKVLVLDEPTESLGRPEVIRLMQALRRIADQGTAILYVSHRLEEVLEITDEITALRDGAVAGHAQTRELDHDGLVQLIIGRSRTTVSNGALRRQGDVRLRATRLTGGRVRAASLGVAAGEIVGIVGIAGSGREDIAPLVSGASSRTAGEVVVDGRPVDLGSPRAALQAGIVYVAADRQTQSAIPQLSVQENLTMPRLSTRGPLRWLGHRRERGEATGWLREFRVRPQDPGRVFATLSGGNQQKVVLARALRCRPAVLVVDEPVQGVDVGAKASIYQLLIDAARDGVAVLLASSDVEEVAAICDRVLVMRGGAVSMELSGDDKTPGRINEECLATAGLHDERGHEL